MVDSKEEFRALVEGIDLTTESGQALFAALLEISPAFSEYIDQLEEQTEVMVDLSEAAKDAFSMLEKAIQLDKQRAAASLDIAREAHNSEISRIDGLRTALESENKLRNDNLAIAEDMLNRSFGSEMDRIRSGASEQIALIQSNSAARINGLNSEKTAINETASSMRSLVSSINSSLGLTKGTNLIAALSSARSGDFSKAKALDISGLSNLSSGGFF